jgi:hypothetical protein
VWFAQSTKKRKALEDFFEFIEERGHEQVSRRNDSPESSRPRKRVKISNRTEEEDTFKNVRWAAREERSEQIAFNDKR